MSESTNNGGIGVLGLLQAAFIFCKLAGLSEIASWTWWYIFTPTWIGIGIVGVVLLCLLAAGVFSD